ncbi:MAG: hypothetical protein ACD_82C00189G0002 [uncultured bacterium]|nr:MAG: hypothetical protein ACD_82C00189G0002 [uncultured bacterium]
MKRFISLTNKEINIIDGGVSHLNLYIICIALGVVTAIVPSWMCFNGAKLLYLKHFLDYYGENKKLKK